MLGLGAIALFYLARAGEAGSGAFSALPLMLLAGLSVVSAVLTARWRTRDRARRRTQAHGVYLRTLIYKQARLQAAHDALRALLETAHPPPQEGAQRALDRANALWGRRADDPAFAVIRLGVGDVPAPLRIVPPDPDRAHPLMPQALKLAEQYRTLHNVPSTLSLIEHPTVALCGPSSSTHDALRAWMCGLALAHHPRDMQIYAALPHAVPEAWRWLQALPHASPTGTPASPDGVALTPDSARALLETWAELLAERRAGAGRGPHLLLITDDATVRASAALRQMLRDPAGLNASLVVLCPAPDDAPSDCRASVTLTQNRTFWCSAGGVETHGTADVLDATAASAAARALAAAAAREGAPTGVLPRDVPLLSLYGLDSAQALPALIADRWRQSVGRGGLPRPVPVGRQDADTRVELALDEAHHGPHGMLAGTTGAGKSEFLQSLICALAIEHDPRLLCFLLLDFKGGSALSSFARLPHTVGLLTNLDGLLVERALEALRAELTRRQTVLRQHGLRDVGQYHRLHSATPAQLSEAGYQALPHLLIIVDEFAQLAREMPEFLDELVRVAQVGRSLGVHLILGTQSPTEVVTDEMSANLHFRLCFRVQSVEASRAVLRRPEAAYLPADWPGRAYLQVGEGGVFVGFQAAYAGGELNEVTAQAPYVLELLTADGGVIDLLDDGQMPTQGYGEADLTSPSEPYTAARAVVDAVIEVAQVRGVPFMPPLLLPPLGERLPLRAAFSAAGGGLWNGAGWPASFPDSPIGAPVGLLDDVTGHAQPALTVQLRGPSARAGHLLITGAPNSGKTTALLTLALALALSHSPDDLHLYALCSSTGELDPLAELPHAAAPVTLSESERVRLLMRRLLTRLDDPSARTPAAVVLLLDGFEALRDPALGALSRDIERLVLDGRAAGVYLAVTTLSIASVPERMRAAIPQRIALQPATPSDLTQTVGAVAMRSVSGGRVLPAGRGFVPESPPRMCQLCLPTEFPSEDPPAALRELGTEMQVAYRAIRGRGHGPAPLRPLPAVLPFEALTQPAAAVPPVSALGVLDADGHPPLLLDWQGTAAALVIVGPPRTGKTHALYAGALGLALALPPTALALALIDFTGRSLAPLRDWPHTAAHLTDPDQLAAALPHLTREARRVAILIDDYDLFSETLTHEDAGLLRALRDLARARPDLSVWAAGYLDRAGDPLIRHLLMRRAGLAFGGRDTLLTLGVRAGDVPSEALPVGRAYWLGDDGPRAAQIGHVSAAAGWAATLRARWGADGARWTTGGAPAPSSASTREGADHPPLDIDTAGLMDDLLGGGR
jgi:S-DNA-T family DNA segregation ATPase FtsK/SpoIIIE